MPLLSGLAPPPGAPGAPRCRRILSVCSIVLHCCSTRPPPSPSLHYSHKNRRIPRMGPWGAMRVDGIFTPSCRSGSQLLPSIIAGIMCGSCSCSFSSFPLFPNP
uniref:Uncharacterized protein n=1 Tax=Setaria viridis TaxID=4556 RepID=A0A4U6T380_SETVI|nr:hypothetical protein SEVIR_9G342700v2 [Setaria viridis]